MTLDNGVIVLTPSEFEKKMEELDNFIILDVRTELEHNYEGMIENSLLVDFLRPRVFKREIEKLDKNLTYLIYCSVGKLGIDAASYMKKVGFDNLYVLEGGLKAWNKYCGDDTKISKFSIEEIIEKRKKLIIRLNRIEGQINGMRKMLIKGEYCGDILNQALAVKSAMASVNQEIMEVFLNTCMISPKEKEDFFRYMKKLIK
ncbi:metal-sensing transcriptional repressor [uncultured Brachyspira sp.]|uniref:metal-sensing transcriptional repressor n=1 Tax=uncultured Brachyspira sp. TaxID=221953 RepID=UPI0025FBCA45|nr:metal-sensing transcriptional repressor [uncultured Brachyspira sp.]